MPADATAAIGACFAAAGCRLVPAMPADATAAAAAAVATATAADVAVAVAALAASAAGGLVGFSFSSRGSFSQPQGPRLSVVSLLLQLLLILMLVWKLSLTEVGSLTTRAFDAKQQKHAAGKQMQKSIKST